MPGVSVNNMLLEFSAMGTLELLRMKISEFNILVAKQFE